MFVLHHELFIDFSVDGAQFCHGVPTVPDFVSLRSKTYQKMMNIMCIIISHSPGDIVKI